MASLDRLPMLESQCRGYEGPISAAIYLPLLTERNEGGSGNGGDDARMGVEDNGALSNSWRLQQLGSYPHDIGYGDEKPSLTAGAAIAATLDELMLKEHGDKIRSAREMVQALSSRVEALRFNGVPMCELTLMLFAERTADSQIAAIMPTNALRNAAGVAVRTALAAMLDADLGVSSSFNSMIKNASWIEYLMEETHASPPALCVLPAYEANPQLDDVTANRISDLALAGSKLDLIALWANATVKVFHVDGCRSCHRPINHVLWTRTQVPYEVDFHRNFEPWGILSRFQDPGYDERFRGWAFDKIQHVESLANLGDFRFVILPDVWTLHRPHPKVAIATLHRQVSEKEKNGGTVNLFLKVIQLKDGRTGTVYKHYMSYVGSLIRRERSMLSVGGGYQPQLNPQLVYCKSVLPWWNVLPNTQS
ncbi:hypothetical protein Vafri_9563 [Volvox africanus]|uniref:Uncharacterized protein n=1 Tax=Volvox africanus TaxID=51714 RepID=A0A8J4B8Y2_9CHLO|nr:hypothetical protein Vafri_9563 [Volvox africanus]